MFIPRSFLLCVYVLVRGLLDLGANPPCGNTRLLQHAGPAYTIALQQTDSLISTAPVASRGNNDVLVIPVVVHILHTGENIGTGSNISDARIIAAVNTTNREWNDAADRGANMAVEFCLAQVDPDGRPTSGIIRVDASDLPGYASNGIGYGSDPGADEYTLKQLSNWPHDKYYNIWVVNKIAGGWAGFAYYPTSFDFSVDGTIIVASSMASNNKVLAHELGHGLGLYHTFEEGENSCPGNANCLTQGDRVCDTPPHKIGDCFVSDCYNEPDLFFSTNNIMSYCSLTRKLYSEGQKVRSRNAVFNTVRSNLLTAGSCEVTCIPWVISRDLFTCNPDSVMTITDTLIGSAGCDSIVISRYNLQIHPIAGFDLLIFDNGLVSFDLFAGADDGTSITWDFGDGTYSSEKYPYHQYLLPGEYVVTLTVTNTCGSDTFSRTIAIVPTRLNDHNSSGIHIAPNPSKGTFEMEYPLTGTAYLHIFNVLGQKLEQIALDPGIHHKISLSSYETGLYFLSLIENGHSAGFARFFLQR